MVNAHEESQRSISLKSAELAVEYYSSVAQINFSTSSERMIMLRRLAFVAVATFTLAFSSIASAALDRWYWRNPYPQSKPLRDVCFGNGTFVAVGENALLTSTNGEQWVNQRLPFPEPLKGVTFANGLFVAVGWNGTILTSSNAVDWIPRNSGIYREINKVVYGNGKFVAVTEGGVAPTILVSSDGINWAPALQNSAWGLVDVAFGNNTFVGVGESWVNSGDATNWTERASFIIGGIIFGNGLFVACGNLGHVYTSYDGASFEGRSSGAGQYLSAIGYGAGMFVAAGGLGAVAVSTDGTNWIAENTGFMEAAEGIAYGNGKWVIVGDYGRILVSSNAFQWNPVNYGVRAGLADIASDDHVLVAVGDAILTSPDGIAWTLRSTDATPGLYGVCHGSNGFVAVGESGAVLTSPDGMAWSSVDRPVSEDFQSITFGADKYVAVGRAGLVATSANGAGWLPQSSITSADLLRVIYANDMFVAVGSKGTIMTSTNAVTWEIRDAGLEESMVLGGVAWGNGRFVAAGWNTQWINSYPPLVTSFDGATWTNHPRSYDDDPFGDVAFGNGIFVAAGGVWTSLDGIAWSNQSAGKAGFSRVAYINGRFFGVGYDGAIMESDPINRLHIRAPGQLELIGLRGATNRIEISSNLVDWVPMQVLVNATGVVHTIDIQTNVPTKFYRTVIIE